MAIPRIFVSSTCYDLKYIRENLKYFIKTIGYEPVLSEEGAVFYDPGQHTHDSCLTEIPNCQMFVLIIGGRYGAQFRDRDSSVTNEEYREAIKNKIPVFALVEQSVYSDHHVYITNKENRAVDEAQIIYPSADSTKIFEFIEEVRTNVANNAIAPFKDFSDIESYLRQQWAGMMFSFLSRQNEQDRVANMMTQLVKMSERIEFLSSQVLKSVGSEESKTLVYLYDLMLDNPAVKALLSTGYKPDPITILMSDTLLDCAENLGKELLVVEGVDFSLSSKGEIEKHHLPYVEKAYQELRAAMIKQVEAQGQTVEGLIASQVEET